ncbi:cysteine desulfurase family protein [Aureimonas sp. D3]|uniref:cysteine desulfurase family protein n=1 Tax=Aureimonas sp. D3 TaxID=1638164 RepID=UPI000784FE77|nr:cysteine desulfurase family protein [Aureimonas sp. D3]
MTAFGRRIYLDYNASAPLLPEVREALVAALDLVGNPSSVHFEGRSARAALSRARGQIAELVGSSPENVVFTSGASEAAATCLTPNWLTAGEDVVLPRLAVLDTDHPCIRDGGRFPAATLIRLPVTADGVVDPQALEDWARLGPGLLAITLANSETGVIQPLGPIAEICRRFAIRLVIDAVQMVGRLPISHCLEHADAVILSAHKIGGPKGTGAFVLRNDGFRPAPLILGGAQEKRQRAGTEALPLIVGFGMAAELATVRAQRHGELAVLKSYLRARLATFDASLLVNQGELALPQTLALHHPKLRAETVQIALDLEGIAVSAGSACSSGKIGASHVLTALHRAGVRIDPDAGAIRVSFGLETSERDIETFAAAYERIWRRSVTGGNPKAA